MGVIIFVKHVWERIRQPLASDNQDMGVALALYFVYPAILWLLIDKFHGICGFESYVVKQEAIAANNAIFIWFTALLRTYKLGSILLFQADASEKREDSGVASGGDHDNNNDAGCTRQKCRVWFALSQELTAIGSVAFLLLLCLPVLAFWFMFISILQSIYNLFGLLKRLWRDAHSSHSGGDQRGVRRNENDVEFQEFLNNFSEDINESFDEN